MKHLHFHVGKLHLHLKVHDDFDPNAYVKANPPSNGDVISRRPVLFPAINLNGKVYSQKVNHGHRGVWHEAIPPEVKQNVDPMPSMMGFINHKGQFLKRNEAQEYAKQNGLIHKRDYNYPLIAESLSNFKESGAGLI